MAEYKVSSNDAELLGGMLQSLWTAFPKGFEFLVPPILAKYGVSEVVSDSWYRLQPALDAVKEIEEKYGSHILYQTGQQAAAKAPVPMEVDTLKKCLQGLNSTLRLFHRGGDIGGYEISETIENGYRRYSVIVSTPYPCSLTRGYLEGFAKRFGHTEATEVLVRHDESTPCRKHGADKCTYIVTLWY